ncbi:hypothetical protein E2320_013611 [Naja naja]|nr:hypothetical protein E2320_013611 [Naja naja]
MPAFSRDTSSRRPLLLYAGAFVMVLLSWSNKTREESKSTRSDWQGFYFISGRDFKSFEDLIRNIPRGRFHDLDSARAAIWMRTGPPNSAEPKHCQNQWEGGYGGGASCNDFSSTAGHSPFKKRAQLTALAIHGNGHDSAALKMWRMHVGRSRMHWGTELFLPIQPFGLLFRGSLLICSKSQLVYDLGDFHRLLYQRKQTLNED